MRICPQCGRQNKPRAHYCDQCGFHFGGALGSLPPTVQSMKAPIAPEATLADSNPYPEELLRSQPGIPHEPQRGGRHEPTQKVSAGPSSQANRHHHETIKVVVPPEVVSQTRTPQDPEPDATVQGAVYRRFNEAIDAAEPKDLAGWLVATTGNSASPGPPQQIRPLGPGITLIGSDPERVGRRGIVLDRPGVEALHGLILHRGGRTWYVDLASEKGSTYNGQVLAPVLGVELTDRTELGFAGHLWVFRQADPRTE